MTVITARPCPFCKSPNIGVKDALRDGHRAWAYCSNCGKTGRKVNILGDPSDSEIMDRAYEAWNHDIEEALKIIGKGKQ